MEFYEFNFEKSIEINLNDLKKISTRHQNHPYEANILNNIGLAYHKAGDFEKSIDYLKKSMKDGDERANSS